MFGYAFFYTDCRLKQTLVDPLLDELIWDPLTIDLKK
jgi:hypothetical protein